MCRSTANLHSVSLDIPVICKNLNPAPVTQSQALTPKRKAKQAVQSGLAIITTATVSLIIAKQEGNVHELS